MDAKHDPITENKKTRSTPVKDFLKPEAFFSGHS